MTLLSIIAAMIRSLPCCHTGQLSISIQKSRLSKCAQLQFGEGDGLRALPSPAGAVSG
jgi:hypothetical protein